MDISKYFRESLGIRDNESRLYLSTSLRVGYMHQRAVGSADPRIGFKIQAWPHNFCGYLVIPTVISPFLLVQEGQLLFY